MDIFVKALAVLGSAVQIWVLTRLPAPKLAGGGVFRQKPEAVSLTIACAAAALLIHGIVLLAPGDPWVALIFWAGGTLFTAMSAGMAFTGVRYGEEGFAVRDELGRRRFVRWEEVLAWEKGSTAGGRPAFRLDTTLVYAPGVTLALVRTLEGRELAFLDLLHRKRPDLPAGRPDSAVKPGALLNRVTAAALAVILLTFVLGGLQAMR